MHCSEADGGDEEGVQVVGEAEREDGGHGRVRPSRSVSLITIANRKSGYIPARSQQRTGAKPRVRVKELTGTAVDELAKPFKLRFQHIFDALGCPITRVYSSVPSLYKAILPAHHRFTLNRGSAHTWVSPEECQHFSSYQRNKMSGPHCS